MWLWSVLAVAESLSIPGACHCSVMRQDVQITGDAQSGARAYSRGGGHQSSHTTALQEGAQSSQGKHLAITKMQHQVSS